MRKSEKNLKKALKKYNSRPKMSRKAEKRHVNQMKRLRKLYVAAKRAQLDAIESIPYDPDWLASG